MKIKYNLRLSVVNERYIKNSIMLNKKNKLVFIPLFVLSSLNTPDQITI